VVIARGEIRWADLGAPDGSAPAYRRPVVVVSADAFNASRINTVLVATISSNTALAEAPGNVSLPTGRSGLSNDSVVNVSQVATIDKRRLSEPIGRLTLHQMADVDAGLRLTLSL
jgi:mRNA interferase MazF